MPSADPPAEKPPISHDHDAWQDSGRVFVHSGRAFVKQFTEWDSWAIIAGTAFTVGLLTLDELDTQWVVEEANILGKVGRDIADYTGLVLNPGTIPITTYIWGRVADDEKLIHFALEVGATQIIVMAEFILISFIPFHERPAVVRTGEPPQGEDKVLDELFRGQSAFPAGHQLGAAVLAFKGWEYYGWKVGVPASALVVYLNWARIENGSHYWNDVVGGLGIVAVASLATSRTRDIWTREVLGEADGDTALFLLPTWTPEGAGIWAVGHF